MGGPPLVSPNRVKVGVSVRNDEDERDTWLVVMTPCPGELMNIYACSLTWMLYAVLILYTFGICLCLYTSSA